MTTNKIEEVAVRTLRAHSSNARTHSRRQIRQLAQSIEQFGFTVPILTDEAGVILAGHARWLAAKELDLKTVPVVALSGLTDTQKRAYLLADNKLAEKAGWDRATLAVELDSLTPLLEEARLDISLTGFEAAEIDALLGDLVDPKTDPADECPELASDHVC